ncbi:MAG TPA: PAS domain S-box protein [Terriglobales bacterium]|nr:PAS domain S-box protein [Terriglobales bacterium]
MAQKDEFVGDGTVSGDAVLDGILFNYDPLDAVDLPIIVISRDCTIARINRAATTVLGLKVTDVGRRVSESLPRVENLDRVCARVIADGAPHRIETRDNDRYFLLRIAPYTGRNRQVAGSVLAFTNITAFRASIDQAIYEREYTKAILNAVIDPLVVLDAELHVQTANRAFYTLFGLSRDQTQGIPIRKLGNKEWETSESWKAIQTTLSSQTEFQAIEIDGEFPVIGKRTFVLDARRLARDADALVVMTFQDITERKQAQRTTSLLAAIVDYSDDAIVSNKLDGTLSSWNKGAERLFGYMAEEAIGQHITLIVPWELRSEEEDILRRLARGERVDHFETARKRKDGTNLDVSLTISPIRDGTGRVIGASNVARDITDRKRAERALSEQARLLDLSNDAIFVRDGADRITYWNRAATELYGFTREEALGQISHDLLCTQFPAPLENIDEQLHHHERWSGELVHLAKDGTKVIVASRWVLDQTGGESRWCVLETNNDITQQKRIEKALRESEERFRAIVETTPECVKLLSADGTLLHMNLSGLRLVGAASADEVIGKSIYDLVAPEDRARYKMFNESICRGEQGSLQFEIVGLEGKRRQMETHAAPLRNADGTVVHLAITADISERKRAEELLRQSEERFRALVNASSDMVYNMSPDWSEMGELDGRGFVADASKPRKDWLNEYIHPDDQPLVLQAVREAVRSKSAFQLEHRVRRADGTLGWTYSRAVPLLNENGEIMEWFGAASDVTARREAEEKYRMLVQTLDAEVRDRTRELERQSNQLRELSWRLLRTQDEERRHIARELHDSAGQTLTVLGMSLAQFAQKTGRKAPELAGDAEQIQETVQQLHREIRTTSYLLHPPLLDESGLYSAISWYVQGLQERSGLDVRLDCSEKFGRLPREMELVIFRLVQECLTNIHRHSGGKSASIRLAQKVNQITLEVRDQGRGMANERLAEVQSGHAGLGIRGMRERLSQFKGTLNIESDGSGTHVFATIPVPKVASPEEDSKAEPLQTAV